MPLNTVARLEEENRTLREEVKTLKKLLEETEKNHRIEMEFLGFDFIDAHAGQAFH